jgi:CubicO group peptidase (beta-lactamase class C family)
MTRRFVPALLSVCLLTFVHHGRVSAGAGADLDPKGSAALATFLRESVARGDVPGVVVAVVGREGVLFHGGFGHRNVAQGQPMTPDAIFNIASMTKPVTSAAIMMLVDEGRLRLDDDVAKFLPKYRNPMVVAKLDADGSVETRPAKRPITIRHLLTHTSGIGYGFSSRAVAAMQQTSMQSELDLPLLFDPGEGWAYGASTRVLGHVVEALSGQRIDAFLQARILGPLGMRDTAYLVPKDKYDRVVTSHARANGALTERPVPATLAPNVNGDGGLYSTAEDYGQFVRMLLNDGRLGSTRLLKEGTVREMFRTHTGRVTVGTQETTNPTLSKSFPLGAGEDTWGLGFQLARPKVRQPNTRSTGSGTWAGIFNTHFWIDREKQVGVIVMMQLLPFYDDQAMRVLAGVEETVYRHLN